MEHRQPEPYSGVLDKRRLHIGETHEMAHCGPDQTGKITYRYNALGFRGPEYCEDAPLRVYVFGESNAFGIGVVDHQAWGPRVANLVADSLGLSPEQVCVMNFSESGGANAYTARMVVTQCSLAPPDLVLIGLSEVMRTEGLVGDEAFCVGRWFLEPTNDQKIEEIEEPGLRAMLRERRDRGVHYLSFTSDEHGWLAMLKELLWMQHFLAAENIPGVALMPHWQRPALQKLRDNRVLAPLAQAVDQDFLMTHQRGEPQMDRSVEGTHYGPRTHDAVAHDVFERLAANNQLERIRQSMKARADRLAAAAEAPSESNMTETSDTAQRVRSFYDVMPFNLHKEAKQAARSIRANSLEATYPDLHALLKSGKVRTVLEAGCGAGWLSCTLAHHYGVRVTAVDFTPAALRRAEQVANALGVGDRIRFVESDLFDYHHDDEVDLVISIGVLHHTRDCREAFHHVQSFAKDDGVIYIGLYHEPGRRPFLQMFRDLAEQEGEDAALERYREFDGIHAEDETMLRSWFRDQVLHPHETQHTVREVSAWLDEVGRDLCSTSINRFGKFTDREELFALEPSFEQRSLQAIANKRYFPGFFTVLAK